MYMQFFIALKWNDVGAGIEGLGKVSVRMVMEYADTLDDLVKILDTVIKKRVGAGTNGKPVPTCIKLSWLKSWLYIEHSRCVLSVS